jgi:hypothetical protein
VVAVGDVVAECAAVLAAMSGCRRVSRLSPRRWALMAGRVEFGRVFWIFTVSKAEGVEFWRRC